MMYFEAGQGSALSAGANRGVDQQTCEARAYAVARKFKPLIVNSVVGFRCPLAVSVTAEAADFMKGRRALDPC